MGRKCRNSKPEKNSSCRKSRWPFKRTGFESQTVNDIEYTIEIKDEVYQQLRKYAQHEGNELCGVLTGSQIDDKTFRISKVSPPCVACNSRCGCVRDASKANAFIQQDYNESEHTRVYVGEWHTHPEANPTPSLVDINSVISSFNTAERAVPFLIMMIVGTESNYCSVYDGKGFIVMFDIKEEANR